MSNPNPLRENLEPGKWKAGESGNPKGRPVGTPNRKTVLNYLLFEADINELGVISKKPEWYDKVKPKTFYELMTVAQAIKASGGDTAAYQALNKAMGDILDVTGDIKLRGATIEFVDHPKTENTSTDIP